MPLADDLLRQRLGPDGFTVSDFRDNHRLIVPQDKVYSALEALKQGGFDMLAELTAADYLHYPDAKDRFGLMYILINTVTGERVIVKTFLNEPDLTVPSAFPLWRGADWMEREVYDLFGIEFAGHPDLRRILMPEGFVGYPLRKDYPRRGYGERHNFPAITRAEG
ncbi:MAG TPA: NADH-quinone oxidoreductase subunit C [Gemmataceae bacterium]|jgi:NADH-quinone oxidoreductase subunit C|nr:NADH-quinone oxidoreductase subunit C [Gemmataceae bacterium]